MIAATKVNPSFGKVAVYFPQAGKPGAGRSGILQAARVCRGMREMQEALARYRIVDRAALARVLGIERLTRLAEAHVEWIEAALRAGEQARVPDME